MIHLTLLLLIAFLLRPIRTKPCLHKTDIPKLTLPWGTWEGVPYGEDEERFVFKNVRFGRPPVDELRFAAPQYPAAIKDKHQIQDSNYGPSCIQATVGNGTSPEPSATGNESEDCLFLDVYVPAYALEPDAEKVPIVVWIYGGAYIFGGKDPKINLPGGPFSAYDGQGIFDASFQNLIWVTGNYRLGAYGFLAGSTMEKSGQPNAGLYDQRLLLDWVQKYIGQVGGDKDAVSVWGLSAGGGSIVHHLTAYGGSKEKPQLFQRAALWSPAFQWAYDREGSLQETFLNFTEASKCPRDASGALQCLRKIKADSSQLKEANQKIVSERLALGMFPFGPAVDGDLVPELPALLLAQGKHVDCGSILLSHDYDEASLFLAKWVKTKEDFTKFLSLAFPGQKLTGIRASIEEKYPPIVFDDNQEQRMRQVLRDSTFVCNKRQVYTAFRNSSAVYAARYEVPPAQHGTDLFPIIWNQNVEIGDLIKALWNDIPEWLVEIIKTVWNSLANQYQRYFAAHALSGDPNYFSSYRALDWSLTDDDGEELTNSMKIGLQYTSPRNPFFALGPDKQSSAATCAFWTEVARNISKITAKDVETEKDLLGFKAQSLEI